MARNMPAIRADGLPSALQRRPDGAVLVGGPGRVGEHGETSAEVFNHIQISGGVKTLFRAWIRFASVTAEMAMQSW
jgi:hypothetical protein